MRFEQDINLYVGNKQILPILRMVQGDTNRNIVCHLIDFQLSTSDTAVMWFERPNGTLYSVIGTVNASANTVSVALSAGGGALSRDGIVKVQLKITSSSSILTTFDFLIDCQKAVDGEATEDDITWRSELAAELTALVAGKVDKTTTVNGKALSGNISLTASDVSAVPTTRKVNGKALFGDIVVSSNKNLLDNPWFLINQRLATAYSTAGSYGVDRWRGSAGVTISGSIISMSSSQFIFQNLEDSLKTFLSGKTLTLSVMLSDGTIYSGSAAYRVAGSEQVFFENQTLKAYTNAGGYGYIYVKAKAHLSIKAVKLELGGISTLENDAQPDYVTELLKCQRYFYAITDLDGATWGEGFCFNETTARLKVVLPVAMQKKPTISVNSPSLALLYDGTTIHQNVNSFTVAKSNGNILRVDVTTGGTLTSNRPAFIKNNSGSVRTEFSADI